MVGANTDYHPDPTSSNTSAHGSGAFAPALNLPSGSSWVPRTISELGKDESTDADYLAPAAISG